MVDLVASSTDAAAGPGPGSELDGSSMDLNTQLPERFLGNSGRLRYWTNALGLRIAAYFWPAATGWVVGPSGFDLP